MFFVRDDGFFCEGDENGIGIGGEICIGGGDGTQD